MNKFLFLLLATVAFSLVSCGGAAEHKDEAATETTNSTATPPPAPAPALPPMKPPFEIKDSSKVMLLEGGVKLYVLQEGSGVAPTPETTVLANYHGRLKDGSVFDSSFDRGGQPISFGLNQVIKGWTVAFTKMKPGSRFVIIIPSEMGYGAQSPSPKIPANSTLIFDCDFVTTL